ncbi:hypothetical protein BASA81_004893 [Batrachochytrium salamandrivorans]|nr:hypothetical protein BASA81_004893 [Batrachochytrium salamandrivorans]
MHGKIVKGYQLTPMPTFVIGNEAGDLDSIVSSMLVAHFLNQQQQQHGSYQAVLPFPPEQFRLRRDAVNLFTRSGYYDMVHDTPTSLLFIDQVLPTKVVLTDANKPGSHLAKFDNLQVMGIFDHHRDERQHLDLPMRVVDETAGSCCSVVLDHFAQLELPRSLALLALGCILLDTRNMGTEVKYSQVDKRALAKVMQVMGTEGVNCRQLYDELMLARSDVSHLSLDELFQLDYKQDGGLGFATLLCSPKLLPPLKQVEQAMWKLLLQRNLDVVCAITSPDEATRGFYLLAKTDPVGQELAFGLMHHKQNLSQAYLSLPLCLAQQIPEMGFGLLPMPNCQPIGNFSAWWIRGALTRKTMLPALLELMSKRLK